MDAIKQRPKFFPAVPRTTASVGGEGRQTAPHAARRRIRGARSGAPRGACARRPAPNASARRARHKSARGRASAIGACCGRGYALPSAACTAAARTREGLGHTGARRVRSRVACAKACLATGTRSCWRYALRQALSVSACGECSRMPRNRRDGERLPPARALATAKAPRPRTRLGHPQTCQDV